MRRRSFWISFFGAGLTLVLSLVGATAHAAQAQTATIRVEVVGVAGKPVEGVTLAAGSVSATTDASGVGTLALPSGSASIVATKTGYQTATARVDVVAGAGRTVRMAMAQTIPDEDKLVASTRNDRRFEDQAVAVTVIGRDAIETGMLGSPGDIASLFRQNAGLGTQITSPVLGTTMVRIQGLPGRYTRLLSDGVPLYGDRPGGHAPLRIPPMDLDRIEVIKGPASAFFGSDALAGAVNLLSRRPTATPNREFLFSQSGQRGTDGVLWLSSRAGGTWSSTILAGGHYQDERDVDGDGWSDIPGYTRGVASPRVYWDNGRGRKFWGVADVNIEKREGGSAIARESLETKTADGGMSGQMILKNGYVLAGTSGLFIQYNNHDFSDASEHQRYQAATIEITLRRPSLRNTWMAGIASDWYAIRTDQPLTPYVSTRPGIFFHDDWNAASWLVLSGSARLDYHNLYSLLLSPRGSALVRGGPWAARFSASQGYFTPRPITEETEAAGLSRLTVEAPLDVETARSVSADFMHTTRATAVTLTVFRSRINNPAQIDRTTYTLRTEAEPIVSRGVEIAGTARRAPFSVTGTYAYAKTQELDGRELALTPRHRAGVTAAVDGHRGRIGVEVLYIGQQRLDQNPYRTTSESYVLANLLGEVRFGRWRLFVNADNLTDVRQTKWDPMARPSRDVDGRWTVDAWAPLEGRVINAGLRISF